MTVQLVRSARSHTVYVRDGSSWTPLADGDGRWRVECASVTRVAFPAVDSCVLKLQIAEPTRDDLGALVPSSWWSDVCAVGAEILVAWDDQGEDEGTILFHGVVVTAQPTLSPEGDTMTWMAKSLLIRWQERPIIGAYSRDYDDFHVDGTPKLDRATYCSGFVPEFNPRLTGNRGAAYPDDASPDFESFLFGPLSTESSALWTLADALNYCFCFAQAEVPLSDVVYPAPDDLAEGGDLYVADLVNRCPASLTIEGLTWLEAIAEIGRQAGVRFRETVTGTVADGPTHTITLWKIGAGPRKTLLLQPAGERLDPALSNLSRLNATFDGTGLVNAPVVLGGRVEIEAAWPLVPGWLVADFDGEAGPGDETYELRYLRGGKQFQNYRDVGRLWLLNETGAASDAAHGSRPLFNLTEQMALYVWSRRERTFEQPISLEDDGSRSAPLLEVSCDGGSHWMDVEWGFEVRDQAAAIWISERNLDEDCPVESDHWSYLTLWEALQDEADVRLRLTAVLVADNRIASLAEVPDNCPVSREIRAVYDRRTSLPWRIRIENGPYASGHYALGKPAAVANSTTEAHELALLIRGITANLTVSGSAMVHDVFSDGANDYEVGDVITEVATRGLSLCASGGMSTAVYSEVVSVVLVLGAVHQAEIVLEDVSQALLAGRMTRA